VRPFAFEDLLGIGCGMDDGFCHFFGRGFGWRDGLSLSEWCRFS
jgi:hypothetical protein